MKITSTICKAVKIHNMWDYANTDGGLRERHPYLYYSPADRGRGGHSASWKVDQHGKSFSDFWRDYGAKVFTIWGSSDKEAKFQEALEWMCNKFGFQKENIVKTPMGSWMNKEFVERRNKEIESLYKKLKSENS